VNSQLGQSIRENGLLQPIIIDENNQIIAGQRRYFACQKMEIEEIETITLKDSENKNSLLISILENIQRENLSDIETALALKQLKDTLNIPQSELSHLVKKSASVISKFLSLLTLAESIQEDLIKEKRTLSKNVLLRMAAMPEPLKKEQVEIYDKYSVQESINSQEAIFLINESINSYYDEEIFTHNPEILFSKNSLQIKNLNIPKDKQDFFESEVMKIISVLNQG
jgi:ParB family transcriptional regulator, chromosome partitioning protein